MPSAAYIYAHRLKQTLKEAVLSYLDRTPSEQLSLYEELAVLRTSAVRAMIDAQPALDGTATNKTTAKNDLKTMYEAFRQVQKMALAIAKIESLASDKFSVLDLDTALNQAVRVIRKACGEDVALADRIEVEIQSNVRLPDKNSGQTDLTPDMDATITGVLV